MRSAPAGRWRNGVILDDIFCVAGGVGQDHWGRSLPEAVNMDKQHCSSLGKAGRDVPHQGWGKRERRLAGTIVEFDRVGLRYGTGAEVLRDLDFRLNEGGFYFLTGPSGAGKTSLLKLLYLAQRPTRGRMSALRR